jgi:putative phosphoribosyl transferase
MLFRDRFHAGQVLAEQLTQYRDRPKVLVLALPRGGVPVAFEVAKALHAQLDVFLVRKLGLPGHEELAIGALASGNVRVLNEDVGGPLQIPERLIDEVARREEKELQRQQVLYKRGPPSVDATDVILVDDGLATGSTMRAAIKALRQKRPRRLIVAVPVGAYETCVEVEGEADELICAVRPAQFLSVGSWYNDFSPTPDREVQHLLEEASHLQSASPVDSKFVGE